MTKLSMFSITGTVLNTFEAPARVDKKTGEVEAEAKPKVQILGEMPVPGEQTRMELVTLTCEDQKEFDAFKNKTVSVPLGIFAAGRGQVIYYIPKGARPVLSENLPAIQDNTKPALYNPLAK